MRPARVGCYFWAESLYLTQKRCREGGTLQPTTLTAPKVIADKNHYSDDLHFLGADLLWRFLLVAPGQDNINLGQF